MKPPTARVLAKQLPGLRDSGGRQRLSAFVESYAEVFERVVVYGFGHGTFDAENVVVRPFPDPRVRIPQVARHSAFAAKWHSRELADSFANEVETQDFVHVDFPQMIVNAGGRVVDNLDFHNIESNLMRARTVHYPAPKRAVALAEVRRLRRLELNAARRARLTTACSTADADVLRDAGARVLLVPNGVNGMPTDWTPPPGRGVVGFVGSMDYAPNFEAVQWLAREVWPAVHRRAPHAQLIVAGRHANRAASLIEPLPNASILDSPTSISSAYDQCDVCVVPLLSGAGTKIKLLEAMAFGRSVVSTSVGLQGLNHLEGVIAKADTAEHFADAVHRTLRASAFHSQGERNFNIAQSSFGWEQQLKEHRGRIVADRGLGIV